MLTDIVTKSFLNLKLQGDMNIMEENYSSIDSYNLKLQNHMLTDIVTKSGAQFTFKSFCENSNSHNCHIGMASFHHELQVSVLRKTEVSFLHALYVF